MREVSDRERNQNIHTVHYLIKSRWVNVESREAVPFLEYFKGE